jgi:hypothetical protein
MLARIMPRKIHADLNAGTSLVECMREIDEREAKAAIEFITLISTPDITHLHQFLTYCPMRLTVAPCS